MNMLLVDSAGTEDKPLKIPKEVWVLVNHLFTKACHQVSLLPCFLPSIDFDLVTSHLVQLQSILNLSKVAIIIPSLN